MTRIVELTADRFHRDGTDAYLTIDRNPVLLPPKLAHLIEELLAQSNSHPRGSRLHANYLFPGRPPSRPRNACGVAALMRRNDLPVLTARNTAMIEAVNELPPIVVADLFGVQPNTAHRWAQFAQCSWAWTHGAVRARCTVERRATRD
jgi:hypothetical protein